jgi:hypothetical protein
LALDGTGVFFPSPVSGDPAQSDEHSAIPESCRPAPSLEGRAAFGGTLEDTE